MVDARGNHILSGSTYFVPRVGEKVKSNGITFKVEDVTYDFGYGTYSGVTKVTIQASVVL
jgi:hypothetical protein